MDVSLVESALRDVNTLGELVHYAIDSIEQIGVIYS